MNSSPEKVIPLVYIDEMRLAEYSKENPLKILYYELEPENEEDKVAFVGISNWKLDSSKSNRGITISRNDLDLEDLKETALTIFSTYPNDDDNYEEIKDALSISYHEYKKVVRNEYREFDGFHSTRDFYHLIKNIAKNLENKYRPDNQIIFEIIENSINRNFSGFFKSQEIFKKLFSNNFKQMELNWQRNKVNI